VRCPGPGRDADPRKHCVSGPTGLFSDVIQSRDSARSMSRSIPDHRCLWLWRESRRKHEVDALVPAVYLDSVLGVVEGGLEVARMAFRSSSIFGLKGTFS